MTMEKTSTQPCTHHAACPPIGMVLDLRSHRLCASTAEAHMPGAGRRRRPGAVLGLPQGHILVGFQWQRKSISYGNLYKGNLWDSMT